MKFGVGTDIQEINRFAKIIKDVDITSSGVISNLFSAKEIEETLNDRFPAKTLCAKFSVKEAFLKAISCGFNINCGIYEIEVLKLKTGKPIISICKNRFSNIKCIDVSISHFGNYVSTNVICEFYESSREV